MGFFRFFKTKKAADERAEIVKKQGGQPTIIIGKDHKNNICYVVGNDSKVNISSNKK